MKNKRKLQASAILILILILIGLLIHSCSIEDEEIVITVKDSIDAYGYTLDDRDSDFFEEEFEILKDILLSDEMDNEKYAEQICKMFVIDFYSLSTKVSRYDVGSLEYLNENIVDSFFLKAEDYIYKYFGILENFPEVKSVKIKDISFENITFNEIEYEGYIVSLTWEYIKDYGYDKTGDFQVIINNDKIEIVEFIGGM